MALVETAGENLHNSIKVFPAAATGVRLNLLKADTISIVYRITILIH